MSQSRIQKFPIIRMSSYRDIMTSSLTRIISELHFRIASSSGSTKMGLPEDWPCADFKDCDFPSTSSVVSAETAYSDLIERYRSMAADPYSFTDPKNEGEKNFLEISKEMSDDMQEKAVDWYGYAIMDINDDGVKELVIGATGDYSVYVNALFTLETESQSRSLPL